MGLAGSGGWSIGHTCAGVHQHAGFEWRNESKAMAMEGLNDPLRFTAVTYGAPQLLDARIERGIAHHALRPQALEDLAFGDGTSTVLEQEDEGLVASGAAGGG